MNQRSEWIGAARQIPVKSIAAAFRMKVKRGRLTPCPACLDTSDKRRADRGPVGIYKAGLRWICNNCQAHGGAVDFAMFRLKGRVLAGRDSGFSDVREWFANNGFGGVLTEAEAVAPATLNRPPANELKGLLKASTLAGRCRRDDVLFWFDSKGYRPGDVPCFILPTAGEFEYRDLSRVAVETESGSRRFLWWTLNKAKSFPVVIPAYDADGEIVNLRGRAITNRPDKQRAATGYDSARSIMADPWQALKILRGEAVDVSVVVIAEGETDYLTFAQECRNDKSLAVFGIFSGAIDTLKQVVDANKWPKEADVISATDDDKAGRAYAAKIAAAIAPFRVRAVPFAVFTGR